MYGFVLYFVLHNEEFWLYTNISVSSVFFLYIYLFLSSASPATNRLGSDGHANMLMNSVFSCFEFSYTKEYLVQTDQ